MSTDPLVFFQQLGWFLGEMLHRTPEFLAGTAKLLREIIDSQS